MSNETIEVSKVKLESLLNQIEELKASEAAVVSLVKNIVISLGIANANGTIKPEIQSGEKNVIKIISKEMGKMMLDTITEAGKERLDKRFGYIKDIIPILNKYAN
jgi:hypothetical protein